MPLVALLWTRLVAPSLESTRQRTEVLLKVTGSSEVLGDVWGHTEQKGLLSAPSKMRFPADGSLGGLEGLTQTSVC